MIQTKIPSQPRRRDCSTPLAELLASSQLKTMDLCSPRFFQPQLSHGSLVKEMAPPIEGSNKQSIYQKCQSNPFAIGGGSSSIADPLCKLTLEETSEFVRSLPMANEGSESRGPLGVSSSALRRIEGVRKSEPPSTPGRPIFSFSAAGNLSRKNIPSKWEDAEKWLISSSPCHDSPASAHHAIKKPVPDSSKTATIPKQYDKFKHQQPTEELIAEKSRVIDEKISSKAVPLNSQGGPVPSASYGVLPSTSEDAFLKDKLMNNVEPVVPNLGYSMEPTKEGFVFRNSIESIKDAATEIVYHDHHNEVHHRDIGTEMTPLGSSTTSRCHTPFKSSSPARYNTPTSRSGPLAFGSCVDMSHLQECHLAKLQLVGTKQDSVVSFWSSREEEEEDVSKSLRHFEMGDECRRSSSVSEGRVFSWEEEEKTKSCLRYQREEAKIQAWVNLQSAKAEAQSKKLEVKLQKMRSSLEEKLMKKMMNVHRRAEEWRATAQVQHTVQIRKVGEQAKKMVNQQNTHISGHTSCGCFPCTNHF